MSFAGAYLEKVSLDPRIDQLSPSPNLSLIVAIPASNEPGLVHTLECLSECTRPEGDIEIIIVLNSGESDPAEVVSRNLLSSDEIDTFANTVNCQEFKVLYTNLSGINKKNQGAGFARKIAMDQALSRFSKCGKPDGIIISLDADTLCQKDYFISIENHFKSHPDSSGCSVYFEHPLEGPDYPEIVYQGITEYELHMRYYIQGLRHAGHPHAFHTVGSAFCIRADIYARQGGMNRRSAGEDFYFLQKIIPLGKYSELNDTRVIPSPRPSGRVAFGTGPTVNKFLTGKIHYMDSFNPGVFYDLKEFISSVPFLYEESDKDMKARFKLWPESIQVNLEDEYYERLKEIRENSAGRDTFTKRFFRWFNMFRTLKYINFAHQKFYQRIPVTEAAGKFLNKTGTAMKAVDENGNPARDLLILLRKIQREADWPA